MGHRHGGPLADGRLVRILPRRVLQSRRSSGAAPRKNPAMLVVKRYQKTEPMPRRIGSLRKVSAGSGSARRHGISRALLTRWRRIFRVGQLVGVGRPQSLAVQVASEMTQACFCAKCTECGHGARSFRAWVLLIGLPPKRCRGGSSSDQGVRAAAPSR